MKTLHHSNRRKFLKLAATTAVAPTIIPSTAIGRGGRPAPSERITMGAIGFGTIAFQTVSSFLTDARVQVIGIADPASDMPNYGYRAEKRGGRLVGKSIVDEHYKKAGKNGAASCEAFEDFREMIERLDLDSVNISTPDHWHAYMAIYAARKGIHVYGQKPLSLTVAEGRQMTQEVERAGITWQTGSQQRSEIYFRMAAEYLRNGRLGKIQEILVSLAGGRGDWNGCGDQQDPAPVPEELNYDLWEGPAQHRAYRPAILPLNWRHNFDYSGGMITDWGAHHIDIVQWALGMDNSGPVKFENISGEMPPADALYNTPPTFKFDCIYEDGTRVTVCDPSQFERKNENGILFRGENGKSIFVQRGKIEFDPPELAKEKIQDDEIKLYASKNHYRNFIDSIYSGEATVAPIETAHRSISICHLANIGLRLGKSSLEWNPASEQSADPAVNEMLDRPVREGWAI